MFYYKDKIERLERRIDEFEDRYEKLIKKLEAKRVLQRFMNSPNDATYKAISLEDLQDMQERILEYLNIELKTTPSKAELVKISEKNE